MNTAVILSSSIDLRHGYIRPLNSKSVSVDNEMSIGMVITLFNIK